MKRKIAVVTSSRADYSHLYWPLHDLAAHPAVDLQLIAMGPHLSPAFGATVQDIEHDGFPIAGRVECLLSSDTDIGMAKTIGVAVLGLADLLGNLRPDLLLLIADRYEMLAPASVALALRIPIAHIEGGEISEGAIDDAVRNALTKMSHIHFTSTHNARARVIAMGEEPWRVHRAGAPSLDHLRRSPLLTRDELQQKLGRDLSQPTILVVYHPVTLLRDTTAEADALFEALSRVQGQILFSYPNADAGSHSPCRTRPRLRRGARQRTRLRQPRRHHVSKSSPPRRRACRQFQQRHYGERLARAPYRRHRYAPAGKRAGPQRTQCNAPDAAAILEKIVEARSPAFRASLAGLENPYGDSHASERIVEVLTTVPLNEELLIKRALPLAENQVVHTG